MLTVDMVRDRLKISVKLVGSQKEWASRHGISAQYLHDVLYGRRNPGKPILDALGLSKIVAYLPTKENTDNEADEAQDAKAFLASPEVQAWKERKV